MSLTFRDLIHTQERNLSSSFASTDISLDLSANETILASTPGAPNLPFQIMTLIVLPYLYSLIPTWHQNKLTHPLNHIKINLPHLMSQIDQSKQFSSAQACLLIWKNLNFHQNITRWRYFITGGNSRGIRRRLKNDPESLNINPDNIKQVFMMFGTNDVDNVLHVDKNIHTSINVDFKIFDIQYILRTSVSNKTFSLRAFLILLNYFKSDCEKGWYLSWHINDLSVFKWGNWNGQMSQKFVYIIF